MDDEMEMNEKRVMTLDDWIRQSPLPRIEARMLLQKAGGYSRVQLITWRRFPDTPPRCPAR